jgi:Sugar-specific transcriptional regulator TrmB
LRERLAIASLMFAVVQTANPRQLAEPPVRLLTPHAHVLVAVAQSPDLRVREIAEAAAITERYAYRVLSDLETGGYVDRRRHGRCNLYRVHPDLALGDREVEEQSLRKLLRLVSRPGRRGQLAAVGGSGRRPA